MQNIIKFEEETPIEILLSEQGLNTFKDQLALIGQEVFEKTEGGRKQASSLSRNIGTLKRKITERFDEFIKAEKAKNDEFVKYLKVLTSTKAKYIAECELIQEKILKDKSFFDNEVKMILNNMSGIVRDYDSLEGLKNAKNDLVNLFQSFEWCEKQKDAAEHFNNCFEKLVIQEGIIARLEKERAEKKQEPNEQIQPIFVQREVFKEPEIKNNYTIIFDAETTGFHPEKDSIVQVAAMVVDKDFKIVDKFQTLIKQSKPISPQSIEIHGKTDEMCNKQGIDLSDALTRLKSMIDGCQIMVGHNIDYDISMITGNAKVNKIPFEFKSGIMKIDTAAHYLDKLRLPPTEKMIAAGRMGYKTPKLQECYFYVFGKEFENAHDAMGDVMATMELYQNLVLVKRNVIATLLRAGLSDDQAKFLESEFRKHGLTDYRKLVQS